MAKVNSTRIATIKGNFEHGEVITETNLGDLIDAIAEAAEAHEHRSSGGDGTGTGDAAPVVNLKSGTAAEKPANPEVGDVYLETDTEKLSVCFSAGSWTEVLTEPKLPMVAAGEQIIASANTERNTSSTIYVKVKEFQVKREGTYRIKYSLRTGTITLTAYARIYRNGSPVGVEHGITSDTYQTIAENISGWVEGDLLQLYIHATSPAYAYTQNFQICIDSPLEGHITQD